MACWAVNHSGKWLGEHQDGEIACQFDNYGYTLKGMEVIMGKGVAVICLLLSLLTFGPALAGGKTPVDAKTRAAIVGIFRKNIQHNTLTRADELKQFGPAAFEVAATLLADRALGDSAASVLVEMNPQKAGPVIFATMPKSDRNVQSHTFSYYTRCLLAGQRFPFTRAMHDAAVRCLRANTNADAAVEALYAIGLTGSKADFKLLAQWYTNQHQTAVWRVKLRVAAEAALARLGHPTYLAKIKQQLATLYPTSITFDQAVLLDVAIQQAAFSNNPAFIPYLCRHLDDAAAQPKGDLLPPTPSYSAAVVLDRLGKHTSKNNGDALAYWRQWWKKHQGEYRN